MRFSIDSVRSRPWLQFAALALFGGGAAVVFHETSNSSLSLDESERVFFEPSPSVIARDLPLQIQPIRDPELSAAIDDVALKFVVSVSLPTWPAMKTTSALHALRYWGQLEPANRNFRSPFGTRFYFGADLIRLFLNQDWASKTVPAWRPVLHWSDHGIAAQTAPSDDNRFVGVLRHQDDMLAACALAGVALSAPVTVNEKTGSLRDVLDCSIATFDFDDELEWSVIAYAHYLPPTRRWTNRFGETYSFDDCLRELLNRPLDQAACLGSHIPYAVCNALRINDQIPILDDQTTVACRAYLKEVGHELERRQMPDGYWPREWWQSDISAATYQNAFALITVTGHHLEWICLAPRDLRPSTKSIVDCVSATNRIVLKMSRHDLNEMYPPLSHLARAMCLARDISPVEVLAMPLTNSPTEANP
jgi:hypothetical protein